MSLADKLAAMKAASAAKLPAETLRVMQCATTEVMTSGILDRTIKVGDKAPDFVLEAADGTRVSSASLRQHGPLLVSLYRGVW